MRHGRRRRTTPRGPSRTKGRDRRRARTGLRSAPYGGGRVPTTEDVLDERAWCKALASRNPDRGVGKLDREQLTNANLDLLVGESLQERGAFRVMLFILDQSFDDEGRIEGQSTRKNCGAVEGVDTA